MSGAGHDPTYAGNAPSTPLVAPVPAADDDSPAHLTDAALADRLDEIAQAIRGSQEEGAPVLKLMDEDADELQEAAKRLRKRALGQESDGPATLPTGARAG